MQRGQLVVLPTDTVYGIGADAFDPESVRRLLAAKGRGREMPPPVLVSAPTTLDALAVGVPSYARALIDRAVARAAHAGLPPAAVACSGTSATPGGPSRSGCPTTRSPSSCSRGPVRSPSAAPTSPAARRATDADQAERMLGAAVAVILDGGPTPGALPSTIVDVTGPAGRVLRLGAVSLERLNEIVAPLGVEISDEG